MNHLSSLMIWSFNYNYVGREGTQGYTEKPRLEEKKKVLLCFMAQSYRLKSKEYCIFNYVYMYVSVHINAGAHKDQKWAPDILGLEL